MTSSSASNHSNPESNGNRDPQADAQSLERIKQILLGDRLDQIMQQLHDIDTHLSHRLATLESRLEEQKQEFNQRISQEVEAIQTEIKHQDEKQTGLQSAISTLENTTTDLHSRLDQSNQGTQKIQEDLESKSQALKEEITSLQGQHQKLISGLSQSFQQLAQDL